METVLILYTAIPSSMNAAEYEGYLSLLPQELQKKNLRFRKMKDRLLNLFGKLLLQKALEIRKITAYTLSDLQYGIHNRPYFDGSVDFSISHSGQYVVCALAKNIRVGIDTEEIATVPEHCSGIMRPSDWEEISGAAEPGRAFAVYWTKKESLIKADNTAIAQKFEDIDIKGSRIIREGKAWYQHKVSLMASHSTCLTTDSNRCYGHIKYMDIASLI